MKPPNVLTYQPKKLINFVKRFELASLNKYRRITIKSYPPIFFAFVHRYIINVLSFSCFLITNACVLVFPSKKECVVTTYFHWFLVTMTCKKIPN